MKNSLLFLMFAFVGMSAAVSISALKITGKPSLFRSAAKIGISEQPGPESRLPSAVHTEAIAALQSKTLSESASKRVKVFHPELSDPTLKIRAQRTEASNTIDILASGADPKHTQIFHNALLDEFINYAHKQPAWQPKFRAEERASPAFEHTEDWRVPVLISGFIGAACGLLAAMSFTVLRPRDRASHS